MSSTAGAIDRAPTTGNAPAVQRQLVAAILLALLVLVVGLASLLLVRRLSGAFHRPLGGLTVIVVAILVESAGVVLRWMASSTWYSVPGTGDRSGASHAFVASMPQLCLVLPSLVALGVLTSVSVPGTPRWGLAFAWFVLIVGEGTHWLLCFRPSLPRFRRSWVATIRSESPTAVEEPEIPVGLVQQVTRILEGDRESIHSLVRAEVPANDRLAVVHLAFGPPLAARPELTAHTLDADNAEVRITQTETFGARIEIRLPQAQAAPRTVLIEVLGSVTAPRVA